MRRNSVLFHQPIPTKNEAATLPIRGCFEVLRDQRRFGQVSLPTVVLGFDRFATCAHFHLDRFFFRADNWDKLVRDSEVQTMAHEASQEPGARSQEPGARSQEPGARSQEPGARRSGVSVQQLYCCC